MPEVESVKIDFAKKTATLVSKTGKQVDQKAVLTALKGAGYGVTKFETVQAAVLPKSYLVSVSGMT